MTRVSIQCTTRESSPIRNLTAAETDLGEDPTDDAPFDIRQATLNPIVVVGQPFVIQPQEVQDRRVKVMDSDDVFDRAVTELVGCPVAERRLYPGTGEPAREPVRVVVAAGRTGLKRRHATELRAEDN